MHERVKSSFTKSKSILQNEQNTYGLYLLSYLIGITSHFMLMIISSSIIHSFGVIQLYTSDKRK